tara:strand:+ start:18156 stop:20372 length:2217 start_codon:yes stop_codon:yes gene_type:complete
LVSIVRNVAVKRVRYKSDNGCVFSAYVLDNNAEKTEEKLNILLTGKVTDSNFRLYEGQQFKVEGRKHGEYINKRTGEVENQLKAKSIVEMQPNGKNFISYIAFNEVFANVGIKCATALYKAFSTDIYNVLERKDLDALTSVQGVSEHKAYTLVQGWHAEKQGRLVEWLDLYGLPVWLGQKLTAFYKNDAVQKIESDPYRLIAFMVSWKKVDKIARNQFNIAVDDPRRLHAAVTESLFTAYTRDGNTALNASSLLSEVEKLIGSRLAPKALSFSYSNGGFIMLHDDLYQSRGASIQEAFIAEEVTKRCSQQIELKTPSIENALTHWQDNNYTLTDEQMQAVRSALSKPLSIITGGAGVGKTSVLEALQFVLEKINGNAIQMALAGRAAKRMQEATGCDAYTIAGVIYKLDSRHIEHATHIIIDECSMVDLYSMIRVLKRLKPAQKVVLVGDAAQLPPVGAGKVFHALVDESEVTVTHLTKVWRQDETTGIPLVSQAFRRGEWCDIPTYQGLGKGVSIHPSSKETILQDIEMIFASLGGNDEDADVKIICPTTRDEGWGTQGINRRLSDQYTINNQSVFTAIGPTIPKPTGFKLGDIVISTSNNWEKGIMNGSLGRIDRMASKDEIQDAVVKNIPAPVISVAFDTGEVLLDEDEIVSLQLGYAITCHKAQGSQFRRVIVPIVAKTMLDRTWIYTALTRGVEQVVFVGDQQLAKKAIESTPIIHKRTVGLSHHLNKLKGCT